MKHSHVAAWLGLAAGLALTTGCNDGPTSGGEPPKPRPLNPVLVSEGREIFRYATFGNETFWTDTARLHEVISSSVSPRTALAVGLNVDADALPETLRQALLAGQVDLDNPATTVALLKLGAVIGVHGTVETINGRDTLVRVGITCALCHSRVDGSVTPGIGRRLDGHAATDLNVGAIVALSPAIPEARKAVMRAWGPGSYDPRTSRDGLNTPIRIPPAYGLHGVAKETYTGDGPVSYWNAYVAVTQMHGHGSFTDSRLGIDVRETPDQVTSLLPALAEYQLSLAAPSAPAIDDPAIVARGKALFSGAARCASCHLPGEQFTDVSRGRLHAPAETGMDPAYANRTATRRYRTTPLRGLAQHAPYFHDGSAPSLAAVVDHYDRVLTLHLTPVQQSELVAYLRTL